MKVKAQKGTKDILPQESYKWQYMEDKAKEIFENANYKEIRTPIFEATELFARGVGSSTDIVNKEMYTFIQKERSLTLRPENTAGVVRAYIEHGMHRVSPPVKLWYKGPMFRYERPQAGRQRQFHQMGIEIFGEAKPSADAEAIKLAMDYLQGLGIPNLTIEINTLGCDKCRNDYKNNLKKALGGYLNDLCEDCNIRYEKNPLRILDCKNPKCQEILENPEIKNIINADYVCEECVEHFEQLKEYLDALKIEYVVNKLLVRGLDYYNRTVFEIKSNALGSQNAVCGGGRYDPLVEMLGGQPTPAVGWAMGMERLLSLIPELQLKPLDIFIVSNFTKEALLLAENFRQKGFKADFDFANKKFGKQLDKASKSGAKFAVILGEDELKTNTLTVKNLETGEQKTASNKEIDNMLM